MQNYINALNLCVAKDELHANIEHPFRQDKYIYASDGKILLAIPQALFNQPTLAHFPMQDTPNPTKIINRMKTSLGVQISTAYIQNMLDQCPKEAILSCRECQGSGQVVYTYKTMIDDDDYLKTYELKGICPICQGTGKEHTATPGYKKYTAIQLKKGLPLIGMELMLLLQKVLDTLHVSSFTIEGYNDWFTWFDIPEGIKIVIAGITMDKYTEKYWTIIRPSQCVASLE